MRMKIRAPRLVLLIAALSTMGAMLSPAAAADHLQIGRSPGFLFAYTPVDVGLAKGFYQKRGLDLGITDFQGAAKMDMALTADSIDVALGSPMEMAGIEKGMPAVAIAAIAHPVRELSIIVPADSPIQSLDQEACSHPHRANSPVSSLQTSACRHGRFAHECRPQEPTSL